ncbi:MAG: dihydropteroate synthase, partial [Bacteroidota bacterium]
FFQKKSTLNCRGKIINLSSPLVMGIVNIGHDSFFDGGKYQKTYDIIKRCDVLLTEGADILDIGAVSTRPGSMLVKPEKELSRLLPALETILGNFPGAIISIDTYNASVARKAIEMGAHMINDISGGTIDEKMFETIAHLQVPYVLMHIQGLPENMQQNPVYEEPVKDIIRYFADKVRKLRDFGVHDIIIDPGFGFGKNLEDNYKILNQLEYFQMFELPIMVGFSRKSMINKVLSVPPHNALNGTTVLNTLALQKGADILRVHDARQAKESIRLSQMLKTVNEKDSMI